METFEIPIQLDWTRDGFQWNLYSVRTSFHIHVHAKCNSCFICSSLIHAWNMSSQSLKYYYRTYILGVKCIAKLISSKYVFEHLSNIKIPIEKKNNTTQHNTHSHKQFSMNWDDSWQSNTWTRGGKCIYIDICAMGMIEEGKLNWRMMRKLLMYTQFSIQWDTYIRSQMWHRACYKYDCGGGGEVVVECMCLCVRVL